MTGIRSFDPCAHRHEPALERDSRTELATFGHDRSTIDGLYAGGTRGAIVTYQTAQGLPNTGEPTPDLLHHLRNGQ